jgi:hypothetical protein
MKIFAITLFVAFSIYVVTAADRLPSEDRTITLSESLLSGLPRVSVKVHTHGSSEEAAYEGVTLSSFLVKSGVPSGEAIRGSKLALVIVARAADGYSAVFALAELDPAFSNKLFLLADRKNGQALPTAEGPFRLVIPDEPRQARWVRQVTSLAVRSVQ